MKKLILLVGLVGMMGCIPAGTISTVLSVLDDVGLAIQTIDAVYQAFCQEDPAACGKLAPGYTAAKIEALEKLRASHADVVAGKSLAVSADAKAAYGKLAGLMQAEGVIVGESKVGAKTHTGWTPVLVRAPF